MDFLAGDGVDDPRRAARPRRSGGRAGAGCRSRGPAHQTAQPISQRSRFGVQRMRSMHVAGTRSSQTVCQMPVVRGYQIECGLQRSSPACRAASRDRPDRLRRARPSRTVSLAANRSGDVAGERRVAAFMRPTREPLTQTVARKSTAPKCSSTTSSPSCRELKRPSIPAGAKQAGVVDAARRTFPARTAPRLSCSRQSAKARGDRRRNRSRSPTRRSRDSPWSRTNCGRG